MTLFCRNTSRESVAKPMRLTTTSSACCWTQAQEETLRASAATYHRTKAPASCASATLNATWTASSECRASTSCRLLSHQCEHHTPALEVIILTRCEKTYRVAIYEEQGSRARYKTYRYSLGLAQSLGKEKTHIKAQKWSKLLQLKLRWGALYHAATQIYQH